MKSQELFDRALKVAPGGVHSPVRAFKSVGGTPVFFERAEGPYLYSVEGKRYIDFCQSFGPLLLGHRDPEVSEAVLEMYNKAWSFGACEPYSLALAEWITSRIPWVEKLRFVSSGTEAVMSALRVARAATGRHKVLKFEGCYHGHVDSLLVKAGSGLAGESASDSAGVSQRMAEETLVAPLDDDQALERVFALHGHEIAVVIIEPLPANYGLLEQREEFIAKMVRLARSHGALVLFDEVITGFRTSMGGMAQIYKIKPDLVCYGKIIGGGMPVGCYGGRAELMNLVAPLGPVYQAGTLSANPLGMVAGLATLQKIERESVHQHLETRTQQWARDLETFFQAKDLPFQVRNYASLFWIHTSDVKVPRSLKDLSSKSPGLFAKLFHGCLERGLYLAPSGFEVGFLSWAHTDSVLKESSDIIKDAASKI